MIGRGLVMDPFLAEMIKVDTTEYPEDRWRIFMDFHNELYEDYASVLQGDRQIILKMATFWEYFSEQFPFPKKAIKRIKKAKSLHDFEESIRINFEEILEF